LLTCKGGNPVVYHENLPYFRRRIIKIIQELPNKSFSAFRERVVDVIKGIRAEEGRQTEDDVFHHLNIKKLLKKFFF